MVNFTTVACRISSRLKRYKNNNNRSRLTEVIVKNKMSRFYGSLCINCDKASYHGVVSASGCPAINEAADVPVDGVDVGP